MYPNPNPNRDGFRVAVGAPCGPAVVQRPLSYSHAVFKVSLGGLWRRFACTSSEMNGLWRLMLLVKYDGMSNRCQLDDGSWLATEGMSNRCQLDDGQRLATENLRDAAWASSCLQ